MIPSINKHSAKNEYKIDEQELNRYLYYTLETQVSNIINKTLHSQKYENMKHSIKE